jgi:hypothetical protein
VGAALLDKELLEQPLAVRQPEELLLPGALPDAALVVGRPLAVVQLLLDTELLPEEDAEKLLLPELLSLRLPVLQEEAEGLLLELMPAVVAAADCDSSARGDALPDEQSVALLHSEAEALRELLELSLAVASTVVGPAL